MISKKVCMLGAFSVGKTSLVQRFVKSIFSEKYLSTIGVTISKKTMDVDGTEISFVLWDMEGKDDYAEVNLSYLRGAMGYFVAADGLRRETLDIALELRTAALEQLGDKPCILLINKADLADAWEIREEDIAAVEAQGIRVIRTSAKLGAGVNEAFLELGSRMCGG